MLTVDVLTDVKLYVFLHSALRIVCVFAAFGVCMCLAVSFCVLQCAGAHIGPHMSAGVLSCVQMLADVGRHGGRLRLMHITVYMYVGSV